MENSTEISRTNWVCPSDRHLALRAKLQTGWSVKSGYFESRTNNYPSSRSSCGNTKSHPPVFGISDDEKDAIIQVIRRAEALDLSEQERVGRLVERLENMKRNVNNVTNSTRLNQRRRNCGSRCAGGARCVCSCALCAERFIPILGASPSLCKDCRKYVCQKCGIETTFMEMDYMKNDYDYNYSSFHEINNDNHDNISNSKRNNVEQAINKPGRANKQFLCRICTETREVWKKSGAWFFKEIPKYIIPEKKERGYFRPYIRTSPWTNEANIRRLSLQESGDTQDSSSDEDIGRRGVWNQAACRISSSNEIHNVGTDVTAIVHEQDHFPRENKLDCERCHFSERASVSFASQCTWVTPSGSSTTLHPSQSSEKHRSPSPGGDHEIINHSPLDTSPCPNPESINDITNVNPQELKTNRQSKKFHQLLLGHKKSEGRTEIK